ncbi:MAG: hypothetical protein [Wigfec virus K19_83]|nr:MAG: hypothetical protein [Wigfec virus K19_83]
MERHEITNEEIKEILKYVKEEIKKCGRNIIKGDVLTINLKIRIK